MNQFWYLGFEQNLSLSKGGTSGHLDQFCGEDESISETIRSMW